MANSVGVKAAHAHSTGAHSADRSSSARVAPTAVRPAAVAISSTLTQSGDGNGLATAPIAAIAQRAVTSQVKGRHPLTRKECTARIGTKVSTKKNATMASAIAGEGWNANR